VSLIYQSILTTISSYSTFKAILKFQFNVFTFPEGSPHMTQANPFQHFTNKIYQKTGKPQNYLVLSVHPKKIFYRFSHKISGVKAPLGEK
jgi:hypothetical protein